MGSYHKPRGYTDKDGSYKRYGSSSPTYIRRDGYFYEDLREGERIMEKVFIYLKKNEKNNKQGEQ